MILHALQMSIERLNAIAGRIHGSEHAALVDELATLRDIARQCAAPTPVVVAKAIPRAPEPRRAYARKRKV